MVRQSFKIAAATRRRFGVLCIVFMCVSFYLVFLTGRTYSNVREEKLMPAEITAEITGYDFNISDITTVGGVVKATPVLTAGGTVVVGDYSADLTLEGINAEYLDPALIDGDVFRDGTTMPYIILNESALNSLRDAEGKAIGEDAVTEEDAILRMERDTTAEIVGVIDDGSDIPKAILSYDTLKQLLNTRQTSFTARITLENAGYEESVTSALNELGYFVSGDSSSAIRWADEMAEARRTALMALGFAVCAAALIAKSVQLERAARAGEFEMLRTAGLAPRQINGILCIRAAVVIFISLCLAFAAAVIGKAVTPIGVACVLAAGAVILGISAVAICRRQR